MPTPNRLLAQSIITLVSRHRWPVIILTLLVTILSLAWIPRIKMDNSEEAFFNKAGPAYRQFQAWKKQFGSDEVIVVALTDRRDLFTPQTFQLIEDLTSRFEAMADVDNVQSLTNVNDIIGQDQDFIVQRLMDELPETPEGWKNLRAKVLQNPRYVKKVISPDGRTTAILIELRPFQDNDIYKKNAIEEVKRILRQSVEPGQRYYVSGTTVMEHFLALYMQQDLKTFMPLMMGVIVLSLWGLFRRFQLILLPLSAVGLSLAITMGFLSLCGFSMNNVTTIIPPILMAIAIADSVHFVAEARRRESDPEVKNHRDIVTRTIERLAWPCFLTTLTTVVGFLSLTLSPVPPVRQLGIVVAFGIIVAFAITFISIPTILQFFPVFRACCGDTDKATVRTQSPWIPFLTGIAAFNERHTRAVLLVSGVVLVLCVWGAARIRVETSMLEYFKKDSPIYVATRFIEQHLSGVHSVNISLKTTEKDYFKSPGALRRIEELTKFLYTVEEVDDVISINDYIKELHQAFHNEDPSFYALPDRKDLIAQYLLLYGQTDIQDFVDTDWRWVTVRVRLTEHSTIRLKRVLDRIEEYLQQHWADIDEASVIGQTVLEVQTNNNVTTGQMRSLGTAAVLIFGMMFLVFRSFSVGCVSIVPNMVPLLINFGIMGWFGIRLDSATSMISAIGIGIVVDDTIHFLHGFGKNVKESGDYVRAMYNTLRVKGEAIVLTSVILVFGFGVVTVSKFVPTSYFGLLSSLIILNALIADLFVLPCLLLVLRPRFNPQ